MLRYVDVLTHQMLGLVSKAWKLLVDKEDYWQKLWEGLAPSSLGVASLAACPTFKSRIGALARGRENMKKGRATIFPLFRGVDANGGPYTSLYAESLRIDANSNYTGCRIVESTYYGSYDTTRIVKHITINLSEFPQLSLRNLERPNIPTFNLLGEKYIFDCQNLRVGDLDQIFASSEGQTLAFPTTNATPARAPKYASIVINLDSSSPWVLIHKRHTMYDDGVPLSFSLFDARESRLVFQNIPMEIVTNVIWTEYFYGSYYIANMSNGVAICRVDMDAGLFVPIFQISNADIPDLIGQTGRFAWTINGKHVFIAVKRADNRVFVYWCELITLTASRDVIKVELQQNQVSFEVANDKILWPVASANFLGIVVGSQVAVIININTREFMCSLYSGMELQSIKFIDDTLLEIETYRQLFLCDFACRGESSAIKRLPRLQKVLHTQNQTGETSTITFPSGKLQETLTFLLGESWSSCVAFSTIKEQSSAELAPLSPAIYLMEIHDAAFESPSRGAMIDLIAKVDAAFVDKIDETLVYLNRDEVGKLPEVIVSRSGKRTPSVGDVASVVQKPPGTIKKVCLAIYLEEGRALMNFELDPAVLDSVFSTVHCQGK